MNLIKVFSPIEMLETTCDLAGLIPFGSAREKFNGLSHLFEHFLIANFYKIGIRAGFTTEDYIMFFFEKMHPGYFISRLKKLGFNKEIIESEKERIKEEIYKKKLDNEERFFKIIWQNTIYSKSPIGNVADVNKISVKDLEKLRKEILKMPLYFFKRNGSVIIFRRSSNKKRKEIEIKITHRKHEFKKRFYDVYYFNGESEKLFLLKNMLQLVNSNKHIQLSEKKKMSALIIERGSCFMNKSDFAKLRETAIREIATNLDRMNFYEKAIKELESIYFYRETWSKRVNKIFKINDEDLLIIEKKLFTNL